MTKNPTDPENWRTQQIAKLNDRFRQTLTGGRIVMTHSVSALEENAKFRILSLIRQFEDFTSDNDPYGEHDFGAVETDGDRYYWKIDYFDKNLEMHSPDETVEEVTTRVMTIMRAEEY